MKIFKRFTCSHKERIVICWNFKDSTIHKHTEDEIVVVKTKCSLCGKIFKEQMSNIEMQKKYYLKRGQYENLG